MNTFESDGYRDAIDGKEPTPPGEHKGSNVLTTEYMDGFRRGRIEKMSQEYLDMDDMDLAHELVEHMRSVLVRMDGNYRHIITRAEEDRITTLMQHIARR